MKPLHIKVIGSGAIGTAIAAEIVARGHLVELFGSQGHLRERSLIDLNGETRTVSPSHLEGEVDLTIVATKAYDLLGVLTQLSQEDRSAPIVCMVNGYLENIFAKAQGTFSNLQLRWGLTWFGCVREGPSLYRLKSSPRGGWGNWRGAMEPSTAEQRLLDQLGDDWQWYDDLPAVAAEKWGANVVINTLCAAHQLANNGALLQFDPTEMDAVIAEAWKLAGKLYPSYGATLAEAKQSIVALIQSTAENMNSMVQDLKAGRRTELLFLSGMAEDETRYPRLAMLNDRIRKLSGQS